MTDKRRILIDDITRLLGDKNALEQIAFDYAGETAFQEEFDDAYDMIERQLKMLLAILNAAVPTKDERTQEQRETLGYIHRFAQETQKTVKSASEFAHFVVACRDAAIQEAIKCGEQPPPPLEFKAMRQRYYRLPKELMNEFNQPGKSASEIFAAFGPDLPTEND